MTRRDGWRLLLFVLPCLLVAAAGGLATASSVTTWYTEIRKPAWTPPGAVFGPVWTVLYGTVAVAGWLLHRAPPGQARSRALALWWAQLTLNFLWSPLFFWLRSPGLATADVGLLWLSVGALVAAAWSVSRPAALLLLPYWAWVGFASALTATIWRLNA